MKNRALIGIIGGSGFYDMPGLSSRRTLRVKTPFGQPSGPILLGSLGGVPCAFLARHGAGHALLPSEINGRANIWALKSLEVERIISVSAVGSLKEDIAPRDFVFPDQLVDETSRRTTTFFGQGIVAHVAFDRPFCADVSRLMFEQASRLGIHAHSGGTLVCMEGPAFSSKAESLTHRRMGYDIIGMTASPEAHLAREAQICYAPMSLVTDYDCWKEGAEVSPSQIRDNLTANTANAQRLIAAVVPGLSALPRRCRCATALEHAIFTSPSTINRRTAKKLELIVSKHLKPTGRKPS
jgi:5'-methylthioadenosine phosphorylase